MVNGMQSMAGKGVGLGGNEVKVKGGGGKTEVNRMNGMGDEMVYKKPMKIDMEGVSKQGRKKAVMQIRPL